MGDNTKNVNIFTQSKYKEKCKILSNDTWFDNVRTNRDFLKKHSGIIFMVDRAEIIDYKNLTMVTPFGTTDITKLSTGCKTLLNILYLMETTTENVLVNVTEAGDKVLDIIFETAAGTNIDLYLGRVACPANTNLRYNVNGNIVEGDADFLDSLDFD